jgi:hypothetical protein
MKEIHYRNIGFPKTGTNWLWMQLHAHPQLDGRFTVFYKEHKAKDLKSYSKLYLPYDKTYNLDPHAFMKQEEGHYLRPENIHEHTTHLTMILRSPYEVLNSMYNMFNNNDRGFIVSKHDYIDIKNNMVKMYSNLSGLFDYWDNCKVPVKYLFYDDLKSDPKKFMHTICEHLGIRPFYDPSKGIIFATDINDPLVFDNRDTIDYINREISVVENRFDRDLSHWKKQ